MSQFGVYPVKRHGLVLDCQHDFLSDLESRIVVPLRDPADPAVWSSRLHPTVTVEDRPYRAAVHLMRAVERRELGPIVTRIDDHDFAIKAALDLLFSGF